VTARRVVVAVVALLLVGMAAAGLVRAAGPTGPASQAQQVEQVAATLRCPTCQGLSVADSPSTVAGSMRDIISEQLAAGRTSSEIQKWFVDRYGEWILLSPSPSGLGWAVWLLPVLALAVGVTAAVVVAQGGRVSPASGPPGPHPPARYRSPAPGTTLRHALSGPARSLAPRRSRELRWFGIIGAFLVVVTVTLVAAVGPRRAGDVPTGGTASMPEQSASVDQLERLRAAVEREPGDVTARVQLAAALLRAGRPAEVAAYLQPVLDEHPNEPDAILLLGIAQIQQGDPAGRTTLERYLQVAPGDHQGRPVAEGLLGRGP
jgi:cytochrome c-type biogenesis protein CcmH/NrfF